MDRAEIEVVARRIFKNDWWTGEWEDACDTAEKIVADLEAHRAERELSAALSETVKGVFEYSPRYAQAIWQTDDFSFRLRRSEND